MSTSILILSIVGIFKLSTLGFVIKAYLQKRHGLTKLNLKPVRKKSKNTVFL